MDVVFVVMVVVASHRSAAAGSWISHRFLSITIQEFPIVLIYGIPVISPTPSFGISSRRRCRLVSGTQWRFLFVYDVG